MVITTLRCILSLFLVTAHATGAAADTITLWDEEQPDIQAVLDDAIRAFEKASPGTKVKRSHFKTEDLRVQFQTAGMGGGGADLILAPNDFAGVFSTMDLIQPVESWANMKRFVPAATTAISDKAGRSWGVPINQGNHLMLFVNKAFIASAPETIADMRRAALAFAAKHKQKHGLAFHVLEPFWVVPFMGAFGGRPLNDRSPTVDGEPMVKALALLRELKFDTKVIPEHCDYGCAEVLFKEKKTAMTINGDWAIVTYAAVLGKDLLIAPLPRSKTTGKFMEPMISGKYLLLNARLKGDRLAAAKAFVEFMVSPAMQASLAKKSKRLPSLASVQNSDVVSKDPLLKASKAAMAHAYPMPMQVEMRAVWDAIRPQLQEVMAGRAEPRAAAKIMQSDAEQKIKQMAL